MTVHFAGRPRLREHGHRDIEDPAELLVPSELVDVEEHGPRGVRIVRLVDLPSAQSPEEVGVHSTEE